MNKINKAFYAALVNKVVFNNIFSVTLVTKLNMNACIEERLFTQTSFKHRIIVNGGFFEHLGVSLESYFCSLYV